jgi:hypothetical protein
METEINDGCDSVREMRFQMLGVERYKYEYNETKRLLRCGRKDGMFLGSMKLDAGRGLPSKKTRRTPEVQF